MSMKRVTRQTFQKQFEDCIAIIEADYQVVHFRYFISKIYGLGVAVTFRFEHNEVEREYYVFKISEEFAMNLTSAYVYITDITTRKKVMNSEMIAIFNAELDADLTPDNTYNYTDKELQEAVDGSFI